MNFIKVTSTPIKNQTSSCWKNQSPLLDTASFSLTSDTSGLSCLSLEAHMVYPLFSGFFHFTLLL